MWRITPPDHLSCGEISPHDQIFSTGTARDARDKYEVCANRPESLSRTLANVSPYFQVVSEPPGDNDDLMTANVIS